MNTKISVVIPTYRRPKLLIECLKALSNQTLDKASFEVIVVSDGPDSNTQETLQPWLNASTLNIRFLQTPTKEGPATARNMGWRAALAPLIAFTDDDCLPAPTWLTSYLDQYNDEDYIVYTGFTQVPISDRPTDYELNIKHLQTADFITANCACTYKALNKVNGFDERFKAAWREDSDLEFRFILNDIPILKNQDAKVVHPVRKAPWGISLKEQKKGIYDSLLFKKYPTLYRKKIQQTPPWNYYLINILWLVLLVSVTQQNDDVALFSGVILLILLIKFFYKRISLSNKSVPHLIEMVGTTILIPTLSIYWRFYGNVKFQTLLI